MIFRAHYPHKAIRVFGKLLGYISLCPSTITNQLVCDRLRECKLVPDDWLVPEELYLVAGMSSIAGVYSYGVYHRVVRKQILYLHPIESPKEKIEQQENYGKYDNYTDPEDPR